MLYILAGASRSGKSIIADKLIEKEIPFFSTDFLMMGLEKGYPEFGVLSDRPSEEIAVKIWPIIKGMATTLLDINQDYLIEGDALLPDLVNQLIQEKGSENVRICFIGYKEISLEQKVKQIKEYPSSKNNWINYESDKYILEFLSKEIDRSKQLEAKCAQLGLKYIDMSKDFNEAIQTVVDYFLKK